MLCWQDLNNGGAGENELQVQYYLVLQYLYVFLDFLFELNLLPQSQTQ